ncbi:hypothetical protein CsSME_00044959 [Camellia sinensis var. sinensis]
MSTGTSTFVIRSINFLTMLLAVAVIGFGIWMSSHNDVCRKSLTLPVLGLGAVIFVISIIGFLGAWKSNSILLWIYLIMLCFILIAILVFTVLAFIVTNNGSGHNVAGLRYKEYQLRDYSPWFLKQTLKQYKLAKLTPIEAGCCRPPSECGYPVINASYYDLSFHPISPDNDCKVYKNSKAIKCYNCDSCKAGVAQYMKTEWRVVAIFNVVLFLVLSIIYFVGCCARRNAARNRSKV